MSEKDCIFCKIIAGEFNTEFIVETPEYVAFHDINPKAPVHALVVPREHSDSLCGMADPVLMGKLLEGVKLTAQKLGIGENFRTVINTGKGAGQVVFHTHFHVLGGKVLP
jgi:histidine triad (HIT) family protein